MHLRQCLRVRVLIPGLCALALAACAPEEAPSVATAAAVTVTIPATATVTAVATLVPTTAATATIAPTATAAVPATATTAPAATVPATTVPLPTSAADTASGTRPANFSTALPDTTRTAVASIVASIVRTPTSGTPTAPTASGTNATVMAGGSGGGTATPPASASTQGTATGGPVSPQATRTEAASTVVSIGRTPTRGPGTPDGRPIVGGAAPTRGATTVSTGTRTAGTGTPAQAGGTTSATDGRYTSPDNAFSFVPPPSWEVSPPRTAGITVRYDSASPRGNFNVNTETLPARITTVAEYLEEGTRRLPSQVPGYTPDPGGTRVLTLGGEPAAAIRYTGTVSGVTVVVQQVAVLKNGVAYVLTFVAPTDDADAFLREAEAVLTSWRFV